MLWFFFTFSFQKIPFLSLNQGSTKNTLDEKEMGKVSDNGISHDLVFNQEEDLEDDFNDGQITVSKIEDIPTEASNPKFIHISESNFTSERSFTDANFESSYTKLKFEINFPSKKSNPTTKPLSTFAELSNKLGPTVNFNNRKLSQIQTPKSVGNGEIAEQGKVDQKPSNLKESLTSNEKPDTLVVENGFSFDLESANTIAEDMDIDDDEDQIDDVGGIIEEKKPEEDDDVVYIKTRRSRSKSRSYKRSRSRSRSYSYSRSRSRSYSYSSYSHSRSRSRSRDYSYSRSRSRSYSYSSYSSRSRSRSRSPSIPRRRGSPSFLDRRRITRFVLCKVTCKKRDNVTVIWKT